MASNNFKRKFQQQKKKENKRKKNIENIPKKFLRDVQSSNSLFIIDGTESWVLSTGLDFVGRQVDVTAFWDHLLQHVIFTWFFWFLVANALHGINARIISFQCVNILFFLSVHLAMSFSLSWLWCCHCSQKFNALFLPLQLPFNQAQIAYLYHHKRIVL